MVLDEAIVDAVDFFSSRLPSGSTVAITNFEAETKELSDFVIQEIFIALANTGFLKVVERSRLEMLEDELDFNMSGSVSDETAQGIGRMTGAQILFSGSIIPYRDMYRMRVQAIIVETAEVIATRTVNINYDLTLTELLGKVNPADAWKYKWLYASISGGYTIALMSSISFDDYAVDIPYGYGAYLMVQPFDLFGITLGFGGTLYDGPALSLLPTLTIRLSRFELDVFIGAGILPIDGDIAILGGVRAGWNTGKPDYGVLFAEVSPNFSLGKNYYAFFVNATVGYQIGFISRKK
jgi:hypothetical protein